MDTISTGYDVRSATPSLAWRVRTIAGGSIGNLVEWYDWYVYAAFAFYFAPTFFPAGNQTVQLLNTAAVFALGFFVRPIGSWLMGLYADRVGRRAALVLSMVAMGTGSLLIGVTPGHKSIGVLAPVVLMIARIIQGLSVGGEYAASATYLSEVAGQKRRGFWSSFQYLTLILGQLLALAVLLLLQQFLSGEELAAWGWRVPFFLGFVCAMGALWVMRRRGAAPSTLRLGDVIVDFQVRRAVRDGRDLNLSLREIEVLRYLAERAGAVVTRDDLLQAVWGYRDPPLTRSVDILITRLRRKIEVDSHRPRYIRTMHGDGYSLTPAG